MLASFLPVRIKEMSPDVLYTAAHSKALFMTSQTQTHNGSGQDRVFRIFKH